MNPLSRFLDKARLEKEEERDNKLKLQDDGVEKELALAEFSRSPRLEPCREIAEVASRNIFSKRDQGWINKFDSVIWYGNLEVQMVELYRGVKERGVDLKPLNN